MELHLLARGQSTAILQGFSSLEDVIFKIPSIKFAIELSD
jgi:hypothetical protein